MSLGPPGEAPEQVMRELSHDLMSPYCPGRTIATCPSNQARVLEQEILEQAEQGLSRDEIEQGLEARFGNIRGYEGPLVVYGSAAVALVAAVLLARVGRRWVRRPATAAAGPGEGAGSASEGELAAVEDALDEIDEF